MTGRLSLHIKWFFVTIRKQKFDASNLNSSHLTIFCCSNSKASLCGPPPPPFCYLLVFKDVLLLLYLLANLILMLK